MPTVTPTTATLTTTGFAPVLKLSVIPATLALTTATFIPVLKASIIPPAAELVLAPKRPSVPSTYLKTGRLPPRAR